MRLSLLALLTACSPKGDAPAGETCTPAPSAAWDGSTAFEDRTADWGLDATVTGGRLAAGDLDGDGFPDLIVTEVFSNARDDVDAGVFYHRVLMNRESGGRRVFVDESVASGLLANRDGGVGTSTNVHVLGDVDNDGDLDVFAGRYVDQGGGDATGDCSEVFLNDGAGHFAMAPTSDVCDPDGYPTAGASFTDYDADGVLDLWVVGWYETYGEVQGAQDRLFRGNGDGTFVDVTEAVGLKLERGREIEDFNTRDVRRPAYGGTACDVDGNALPDLIATNYGRAWNQLWRNDGGAFVEIGEESGFDADDDQDFSDNYRYVCYCEATGDCPLQPSIACPDPGYADYWYAGYDDQPFRLNGNSFTTICGDVDNDGDADLVTTEIVHKWAGQSSDATQLLLNDGSGSFARVDNEASGLARRRSERQDWNEGDMHGALFDFDNDGWKDLAVASSDYEDTHMWLWRQTSAAQFEDVTDAAGLNHPWPAGIAVADFDLDGDLDVVTGSSTARSGTPWTVREVHVYENVRDAGNWVRLTGLPVGTRVEVDAGGLTQAQEVSGGYGHMGIVNDVALHFGLGDACMVDAIRATRPGGETKTWEGVAGNKAVVLSW